MIFLGIDPGLDGALAVLYPQGTVEVFDTPTVTVQASKGKKREYDEALMRQYLSRFADGALDVHAVIEKVHSMPGQGVRSMFSMGDGYGLWRGLLVGLAIPYQRVAPQTWQKRMLADEGRGKDASRLQAQRLFPTYAELFARKKDDGRADAVMLAEYGRRAHR